MKVTVAPVVPVERTVTVEMTGSEARALGEFCGTVGLQDIETFSNKRYAGKFKASNRTIYDASAAFYFATLGKV